MLKSSAMTLTFGKVLIFKISFGFASKSILTRTSKNSKLLLPMTVEYINLET